MLKALELSGFKSFADRTRFEFPRGISVVVGPNGSGKSNLVDAVKWVLGSQSAKSLRGKEMTDVIFNGSGARGPLGAGEVTLTLDNTDRLLAIDTTEVHITRRVYRSGEGEYLINRQACRLRDIRDLLAGTGITTEAYSIIEQGKVDVVLQSSPRDRRIIFEEAAGISRFKAKKAAADRRLERVEQNLLRLSDIVDEVESRLRSVRSQAGKARRYREHATRLQQLRTQVGLVDWHSLTEKISAREEQIGALRRRLDESQAALRRAESDAERLVQQIETATARLREVEAAASSTREQIAARQAAIENQRARRTDLEQEVARFRRQLVAMSSRAGGASDLVTGAAEKLREADRQYAEANDELQAQLRRLADSRRELETARAALDRQRTEHVEAVRAVTLLGNQSSVLESQIASAQAAIATHQERLAELEPQRESSAAELAQLEQAQTDLAAQLQACDANLKDTAGREAHLRRDLSRTDKAHRELERRLTRTRERMTVLAEFEERLEGLTSGVKDVLRLAQDDPAGPLGEVLGVVADLFHVDVDSAPLVEVALGEQAQFLVLRNASRVWDWLAGEPAGVPRRVGFLQLEESATDAAEEVELSGRPGVMGRADHFVETAPELLPLVRRLLGRTWFVDRLATALRLAATTGGILQFVTSDGQLLTADGTLIIGPRQLSTGLLLRRSELRACREQVAELDRQLARLQANHARLLEQQAQHEAATAAVRAEHDRLAALVSEHRHQTGAARQRLENLQQSHQRTADQLEAARDEALSAAEELEQTRREQAAAAQAAQRAEHEQQLHHATLAAVEQRLTQLQASATARQVVAAKCEQRVEMLRSQVEQAERDHQERERALAETRDRLAAREAQLNELEQQLLAWEQSLAELFLDKERHAAELADELVATAEHRAARTAMNEQIRRQRDHFGTLQAQLHKLEMATGELHHERQTLCERMQDDYGIDLAEVAIAESPSGETASGETASGETASAVGLPAIVDSTTRQAVEREIAQLRDQINNIGAVNIDALEELDQLEERFGNLSQQYRDLVDAKASLERIIQRIQSDSRQLFLTTLEIVRGHFQELFRQLFGGGDADIVLDDQEDVLECGIEIVARPPGKEACSISLLSGGEKTLTCVALLLAVFHSKPSPFCILDEVDAALDESNIGRFIGVLRQFLSFTQFIVVTHSKKTMAGADTLYGVTMQESGISKQVSVRFEDGSEEGFFPASSAPDSSVGSESADDSADKRRAA